MVYKTVREVHMLIGTKGFVDPDTGEVKKFLIVEPRAKDRDFVKIRKALTEAAIKDLKYLNGAIKLLFWFIDKAIENRIFNRPVELYVFPEDLAKELNTTKRTVEKYIKLLKDKGYIIQPKKRRRLYMLNPEFIWLGTAQSYASYLKEQLRKN